MKTTSIFPVHALASLILMRKYAQSQQFFGGFPDNILQGWFKMKTTSIFPVHGRTSLILMSKYAHGCSMSSKLIYIYKINQFVSKRSTYYIKYCQEIPGEICDLISSHEY